MSRVESWDLAYERLFGRGAAVAQFAFNLAFGLAIFHPSGFVKLLGILALLAAARAVGSWERRRAIAAGVEVPREALEVGAGAPSRGLAGCDEACKPGCSCVQASHEGGR